MNKNKVKHLWTKRISQEYNEPWRDVINGYLDMGYSVSATAKIVGVNRKTLLDRGFKSKPKVTQQQRAKELGISVVTLHRREKLGEDLGYLKYGFMQ